MKYICGIDSGKQGAFVIIEVNGSSVEVVAKYVMPLSDKDLDLDSLRNLICHIKDYQPITFVLEQLQPIFGAGKSSMWSMCNTYSIIHGMLHALKVNYVLIKAKAWQKIVHLSEDTVFKPGKKKVKDPKLTSLKSAERLFPNEDLRYGDNEKDKGRRTKEHGGIADALLIAYSQTK